MKKLFNQILKFGVVGAICFVIDYLVGLIAMNIALRYFSLGQLEKASVIGSIAGFIVGVIANYILCFKFVFVRKENLDRRTEFIAFLVLSIIGLLLNSLLIWLIVGPIYNYSTILHDNLGHNLIYTGAKGLATIVVMIYNFVTRKIFLEEKKMEI